MANIDLIKWSEIYSELNQFIAGSEWTLLKYFYYFYQCIELLYLLANNVAEWTFNIYHQYLWLSLVFQVHGMKFIRTITGKSWFFLVMFIMFCICCLYREPEFSVALLAFFILSDIQSNESSTAGAWTTEAFLEPDCNGVIAPSRGH